jgi:FkbM family methyltransferase
MKIPIRDVSGEITAAHQEQILKHLMRRSSNYEWMYGILQARARRREGNVPFNSFRRLRMLCNPAKPYFVGQFDDETKFAGNCHDTESLFWTLRPSHSADVISVIEASLQRREGTYIDIGANTGVIAAKVSQRFQHQIPLIAFEAIPETAVRAAATFALNKMENARLFAMAVGDADGELSLETIPGSSGQSSAFRADNVQNLRKVRRKRVTVPLTRLDSMAEQIPSASVIKIDVEGCEMRVLRGAKELIARDQPDIVFEYNDALAELAGWTIADVRRLLAECHPDYRCFLIAPYDVFIPLGDPPPPKGLSNIYCTTAPVLITRPAIHP